MKDKALAFILIFVMVLLAFRTNAGAQGGSVAVVVNPQNALSTIPMGDLRKILSGEKRYWPGGAPVKLFTRTAGTAEHNAMLKIVGMSEAEYKQYWTSKVYQGEAQ